MDIRAVQDTGGVPMDLATMPAAAPPPGITPDFDRIEPIRYTFFATISICIIVCTLVLITRLIARLFVAKTADWSDYTAVLGYAFSLAFMGLAMQLDHTRRARHMWNMSILDYLHTTEQENLASIMYCFGIMFLKLSILLFFLKVFMPTRRGAVYWTNIFLCWLNALFYIGCVGGLIFQCLPRAKISNPKLDGHCVDVYLIFLVTGVCNVLSDFFILAFPIWAVWRLQMPLTRKLYVSVIFGFGAFALLASIMRLHSTTQIPNTGDVTWIIVKVAMWTSAEMTTVLLCCCFPFLPKLIILKKPQRSSGPFEASMLHLHPQSRGLKGSCSSGVSKQSLGRGSEVEHADAKGPSEHTRPSVQTWDQHKRDSTLYSPA